MALGKQIVYLTDFNEESIKLRDNFGTTDLYSFGAPFLDEYFGGGYGRRDGYEIVVLFGGTGIGKTTFALNMIADPILQGKNVGLLMLEDDGPDINLKLQKMLGSKFVDEHREQVHFTPPDLSDGSKLWGLDQLLGLIEEWFIERKMDIILLDHLQFAFESAIGIKGENEYISQRIFVRKINYLVRKLNKTIILVSHVGKNNQSKGMDRIIGSSGIAGSATKAIEIKRADNPGLVHAQYWKSRFTAVPDYHRAFKFNNNQRIVDWDE